MWNAADGAKYLFGKLRQKQLLDLAKHGMLEAGAGCDIDVPPRRVCGSQFDLEHRYVDQIVYK